MKSALAASSSAIAEGNVRIIQAFQVQLWVQLGEFDRAMETYARVFSLTGAIADQLLVSWALDGLGHTHRLAGDLDRALAQFEDFCTVSRSVRTGIPFTVTVRSPDGRVLK